MHPVIENQLLDGAGFIHAAHIIGVGEWYQFGGKWVIIGIDEPKRHCKRNVVPIGFELLILERNFAISLFEAFILISSRNAPPKGLSLPSWYMIFTVRIQIRRSIALAYRMVKE